MSLHKSSSTVSAAGAGRPGAAAYSPLIKGAMEGACDANSPIPTSLPSLPFTKSL